MIDYIKAEEHSGTVQKSEEMENSTEEPGGPYFSSLPEGFIDEILVLTSPRDVCRMAAVAPEFLSAAESDALWKRFLPANYREIIERSSVSWLWQRFSSKELYLFLRDSPLFIDGGKKKFWVEKMSGKKCWMLGAAELSIRRGPGSHHQFWGWVSLSQSRFGEAVLIGSNWWLEIKGNLNTSFLSPKTNYGAYLVFRDEYYYGRFNGVVAESSVGVMGKEPSKRLACLTEAKQRRDGWAEVELGEFFIPGGENMEEAVEMSVMEVRNGARHSGIIVDGIEIRPKGHD